MCQVGRVGDLRDNDEEHAGPAPHQGVQPGGEVIRYTTIVSNLEKSSPGTLPRCVQLGGRSSGTLPRFPTWRRGHKVHCQDVQPGVEVIRYTVDMECPEFPVITFFCPQLFVLHFGL